MKLSQKEIETVTQLPALERYDYFVKRAVGLGKVWGLYQEGKGWELSETDHGKTVFLLWPAKEYAEIFKGEGFENSEPKAIELHDLLDDLIPHLRKQGLLPGMFFVPHVGIVNMGLDALEQDLRTELSFYERGFVRKEIDQEKDEKKSPLIKNENFQYSFFIKAMVASNKIWGLYRDGWATVLGDKGKLIFPLWLGQKSAELCANQEWKQYEPRAITLDEILHEFIPTFRKRKNLFGMFFISKKEGMTVALNNFEEALRKELSFYESGWIRKLLDQGNEYEHEDIQSIQLKKSLERWHEESAGLETLRQLSSNECYDFFIETAVQNKKVWSLYEKTSDQDDGGWVMSRAIDTGQATFPLWALKKYAKACARGDWVNAQPTAISLQELLNSFIPYLKKEGVKPGISFVPERGSVRATLDEVEKDLRTGLSKCESM